MNDIPSGFEPAGFEGGYLGHVGPYFIKPSETGFVVGLRIEEMHINYVDLAHGGVLTTLADVALSLQVHRSETPPLPITTVSLTTHFLSGAKRGDWLEATGRIDRAGKRLAYTSGQIVCDTRTIMTMSGVFNIIRS